MSVYDESATIILNVPINTVFNFVTDIENLPTWAGAFETIKDFSGDPVQVGSTWTSISKFMGREVVSQCEMTAFQSPTRLVFSISNMAGDGDNIWTLEELAEDKTRFTLRLKGKAKGIATMAVGLIRSQAGKQMNSDLSKLKRMLEA